MKKFFSVLSLFFLISCAAPAQFGAGVDITFDPRTIGMQIDDTICLIYFSPSEKHVVISRIASGWSPVGKKVDSSLNSIQ